MSDKKIGVETVAAGFIDHLSAVDNLSAVMRLSVDVPSCDGARDSGK